MRPLPNPPPGGVPITSTRFATGFSSVVSVATQMTVHSGPGYGFIIEAEPLTGLIPPVVALEVRALDQKGSSIIYVTTDKWYDLPFSKLTVARVTGFPSYSPYTGTLLVNVATDPYVIIRPTKTNDPVPAASGGNGLNDVEFRTGVALTDTPPTLTSEGVALGAQPQSVVSGTIVAPEGETITGGTVDLFYYDSFASGDLGPLIIWALAMQGIPVPTGANAARLSFGGSSLSCSIGARYATDRFRFVPNGITLSGGTTVTVFTYVQ